MKKQTIILLFVICSAMFMCSCATLPKLTELPSIPTYNFESVVCESPANCGIMTPCQWVKKHETAFLPALATELKQQGIPVSIFYKGDYLTRNKRLSVDKVIVIRNAKWRTLKACDGSYTDVHVFIDVYNTGSSEAIGSFDVWGRMNGSNVDLKDLAPYAYKNLVKKADFMSALSKHSE